MPTLSILHLALKGLILITSVVFAQANAFSDNGIVDRGFDQLFSIGLLIVFLIYMIYENQAKERARDKAQGDNTELLKATIEALNESSNSNKDVAKTMERFAQSHTDAINRLSDAFEKLESKL